MKELPKYNVKYRIGESFYNIVHTALVLQNDTPIDFVEELILKDICKEHSVNIEEVFVLELTLI